jgi:hypothetical protein
VRHLLEQHGDTVQAEPGVGDQALNAVARAHPTCSSWTCRRAAARRARATLRGLPVPALGSKRALRVGWRAALAARLASLIVVGVLACGLVGPSTA